MLDTPGIKSYSSTFPVALQTIYQYTIPQNLWKRLLLGTGSLQIWLSKDLWMRASLIILMGPKFKAMCLYNIWKTGGHRRERHVKTEIEIGVIHRQAKEDCQHPQKIEVRHWTDSPSNPPDGSNPVTTWLQIFGLLTVRQYIYVVQATKFMVTCYYSPRKLLQWPSFKWEVSDNNFN